MIFLNGIVTDNLFANSLCLDLFIAINTAASSFIVLKYPLCFISSHPLMFYYLISFVLVYLNSHVYI